MKLTEIIDKYNMNGFKGNYDIQGRHLGGWGTDKDAEQIGRASCRERV